MNAIVSGVERLGAASLLGWTAVRGISARAWPQGEVVRQAHSAGNRSLLLVTSTMAFVGMVIVFQAGVQANRIVGDLSLIGLAYIQLMIREFGPVISALMVAARVGAGIAAELGTMRVTEQVDALRMNAADPVRYLVSPRLAAVWVMTVVLCVWGSAVSFASGAISAHVFFGVPYDVFIDFGLTRPGDVLTGFVKAVAFGAAIPVVAAWAGLSARGGSVGVGRATTAAVVVGSMVVIVLDALIGAVAYVVGL